MRGCECGLRDWVCRVNRVCASVVAGPGGFVQLVRMPPSRYVRQGTAMDGLPNVPMEAWWAAEPEEPQIQELFFKE